MVTFWWGMPTLGTVLDRESLRWKQVCGIEFLKKRKSGNEFDLRTQVLALPRSQSLSVCYENAKKRLAFRSVVRLSVSEKPPAGPKAPTWRTPRVFLGSKGTNSAVSLKSVGSLGPKRKFEPRYMTLSWKVMEQKVSKQLLFCILRLFCVCWVALDGAFLCASATSPKT